jgi:hypothetical protein
MIQVRIALFYSASALAGAFSGLLAFALAKMDGVGGLEGLRFIFLIGKFIARCVNVSTLTRVQRGQPLLR